MDIAATSTEYVHVPVTVSVEGNPITVADPPRLAFLANTATGNPGPTDWIDAEWSGNLARLLVGPQGGATTLAAGTYWAWVTWTAGDETPVYRAGQIRVY